jgi:hypothetical protein
MVMLQVVQSLPSLVPVALLDIALQLHLLVLVQHVVLVVAVFKDINVLVANVNLYQLVVAAMLVTRTPNVPVGIVAIQQLINVFEIAEVMVTVAAVVEQAVLVYQQLEPHVNLKVAVQA